MDFTKTTQNIISLCTGMRGIERGLERSGLNIRTLCYVEIEAFIDWNLVEQMEKGVLAPAPIWSNIKTFDWSVFQGKVHGIVGGYPCQPFSVAGKQAGAEDPRHLWPYIADGIRTIKPVWSFFENVRNHLNIGYEAVRAELQEMGYNVREGIYSAEEVGAPHRRDRLFILAIRRDVWDTHSNDYQPKRKYIAKMFGISEKECESKFRSALSGGAGSEMGNTNFIGRDNEQCGTIEHGSLLAYTDNEGLQGRNDSELSECAGECTARTSSASQGWPSRPGVSQHNWEPPRTECRLGFTINGYNFREDLLRMAGNAVVPQTAELAFIDLLKKYLNP